MDLKIVILVLLSFVVTTYGQGYFGEHNGVRRLGRIPGRCPPRSPRIRCFTNPCHGNARGGCPNYPNAVCINDNPCEPWCIGHYYTGRQRRLTRQECFGEGSDEQDTDDQGNDERPADCPPPRLRCLTNPCDVETCPSYPNARCVNDDPCERFCIGHFYDGDTLLTRRQCRRNRRGRGQGHRRGNGRRTIQNL